MWIIVNVLTGDVLSSLEYKKENKYRTFEAKQVLLFSLTKTQLKDRAFLKPKYFIILRDAHNALYEHLKPKPNDLAFYEFVLVDKDNKIVGSVKPKEKHETSYYKRHS